MSRLHIADGLTLPLECVTQTFGVLAKRRAGKSYLAARFVEELWAAKQQVVVLDPKGDSWGLRSSSDGKHEGIPILILGGEHGDVRLESSAGEVVARMVVEERVSAILDLSEFRKHEVATFATAFLETLYRLKAKEQFRTAMMLVIDEADAIAPQRPQRGEERMLGAAEDIVRRGGQRGIGCFMATQRAAVINKNLLTQVQILVALRTIAPQDLAAMEAWIDVHGTPEEREELMHSLPSLATGTAWFWSPGWPTEKGIFVCVKVSPRVTFDSGATPKPGESRAAPKTVADVDLGAVQKRMAAVLDRQKADDPKELRRRIAELERQVKTQKPATAPAPKVERVEIKVPFIPDKQLRRLEVLGRAMATCSAEMGQVSEHLVRIAAAHVVSCAATTIAKRMENAAPQRTSARANGIQAAPPRTHAEPRKASASNGSAAGDLAPMERRFLTALAQYPEGRTRAQLLTLAAYAASGPVSKCFAKLRAEGWMVDEGKLMRITREGVAALGDYDPLPTGDDLIEHWLRKLDKMPSTFLGVLVANRGRVLPRAELLEAAGYAASGPVSKSLALLTRLELMRKEGAGMTLREETFS